MNLEENLTPRKYDVDLRSTCSKIEGVMLVSSPLSQTIKLTSKENDDTDRSKLHAENKKLLKRLALLKRERNQSRRITELLEEKDFLITRLEESLTQHKEEGRNLKRLINDLASQNSILKIDEPVVRISETLQAFKSKMLRYINT